MCIGVMSPDLPKSIIWGYNHEKILDKSLQIYLKNLVKASCLYSYFKFIIRNVYKDETKIAIR